MWDSCGIILSAKIKPVSGDIFLPHPPPIIIVASKDGRTGFVVYLN